MNKVGRHTGLEYRRLPKPFKEEMKKYMSKREKELFNDYLKEKNVAEKE